MRWSVKVHRSITHMRKMGKGSEETWKKFRKLFSPLDNIVDFYLFQLPPSFSCRDETLKRIEDFESFSKLGEKMALEFRSSSCFREEVYSWGGGWGSRSFRLIHLKEHG